jgi:hypothetical protein
MDKACDEFVVQLNASSTPHIKSVFEGKFFRTFYHNESKRTLFLDRPDGEGRYAFALFVDFFTAEGASLRNAHASLGIIALACLNLPADIRYKPENMFLAGIVPGPEEPKLELLNHYQRPLVSDMKLSWERGVFVTRTALCPRGRLTRSAIAVGVFDLPAGRKAAALAGHGADWFCSVCDLRGRAHLPRTDYQNWPRRDPTKLRVWAERWRDASSIDEQTKIFQTYGVRWSELWRLSYWDPTRMLVVDTMHCLYEGLIKMHCRVALNLSVANANAPEPAVPAFSWHFASVDVETARGWSKNDIKCVSQIHNLLVESIQATDDVSTKLVLATLSQRLSKKNMKSLAFVCRDLGCIPVVNKIVKSHYVEALVKWRSERPLVNANPPPSRLVNAATITRIREVIRDTVKPSWLNSLPSDLSVLFGTSAAGSFKADEWRTFFTVFLPLALISLWGDGTVHSSLSTANHLHEVLDHTMALVCAVLVAGSHYMTLAKAQRYRDCIQAYVANLPRFYPHLDPRINQHMAFHVYDFLLLYGPIRSWWCFPFERLIGVLQNLPSNHNLGLSLSLMHISTKTLIFFIS